MCSVCLRSSCRVHVDDVPQISNRGRERKKKDTPAQRFEENAAVDGKMTKYESLDTDIEKNTNASGGSLGIPEANVRRHSIGNVAIDTSSIVQRLQEISVTKPKPETEAKIVERPCGKKPISVKVAGPKSLANQQHHERGPITTSRERGTTSIIPGGTSVRAPIPRVSIQDKRTSIPDLTIDRSNETSLLKPITNQMSTQRRFSSSFLNLAEAAEKLNEAEQQSMLDPLVSTSDFNSAKLLSTVDYKGGIGRLSNTYLP